MICMRCETRSADTGGLCTPCLTTWTDRFAAGVCAICGKDHEQASKLQPPASPPELPSTVIAIVGSGSPACAVLYRWSPDGSWPHCDQPFADEELFKEVRVPLQSDAAGFEQAMLRIGATVARLLRERDAGTARAEKAESDAKLAWRRVTELQQRGTELVEERRAAQAKLSAERERCAGTCDRLADLKEQGCGPIGVVLALRETARLIRGGEP